VEISPPSASGVTELIDGLIHNGFKPIEFPGCVTDVDNYIRWHEDNVAVAHHSACGGFGMALRLQSFQSPVLEAVDRVLKSDSFNRKISEKFGITFDDCVADSGIQKYLDGYEISPHPDTRSKAATFMVNINPSSRSESLNYHTQYLKLKNSRRYVQAFGEGNESVDRAWVPWDWAETVKRQTSNVKRQNKNNSIVLFSPSNDTLHAVKASYDHLQTQRTRL
jgi:hypothetical protein